MKEKNILGWGNSWCSGRPENKRRLEQSSRARPGRARWAWLRALVFKNDLKNQRRISIQENATIICEFWEDHSRFRVGNRFKDGQVDSWGGYRAVCGEQMMPGAGMGAVQGVYRWTLHRQDSEVGHREDFSLQDMDANIFIHWVRGAERMPSLGEACSWVWF